jgi:tetratricopeptide (TPR) repeat protein
MITLDALVERSASPAFARYRSYFDLGEPENAPLCAYYPLVAYEAITDGYGGSGQRQQRAQFRVNLLAESGLHDAARLAPSELPTHLRTERWESLCEYTERFDELEPFLQARVARLLCALCFHRLLLDLIPADAVDRIVDAETAAVAYMRAYAKHCLLLRVSESYDGHEIHAVLERAPIGSRARYAAALALLVNAAKFHANLEDTIHFRAIAQDYIDSRNVPGNEFGYSLMQSVFYRAAAYVPFLQRDWGRVEEEIVLCEEWARAVQPTNQWEEVLYKDNLYVVFETQMRVAVARGDLDRAQALIDELIELDPWDARIHVEHGEVLVRRNRLEEAADAYDVAAALGPPGTATSFYLGGFCRERTGDVDGALIRYLRSVRVDPDGISPLMAVLRLARTNGDHAVMRWASARLDALVAEGAVSETELADLAA